MSETTEKFVANSVKLIKPLCDTCANRSKTLLGRCIAFPDGIPLAILTGDADHRQPVEGDHGIQYEESK